MKRYIAYLVESTEDLVKDFMKKQVKDPTQPEFGGLKQDLVDPKPTVYKLISTVALYCHKDSRYYKDPRVKESINLALDFITSQLRPSGTFDFPSCNFASAPDTSFILKQLFPMYQLMDKYLDHELDAEKDKLLLTIKQALMGIMQGGFHTPNHRWAITAALMQGYNLFKEETFAEDLLKRANKYLAEGIDGNEDGEYAERSTGNYNAVVNSSMITLYEETGDEKYLGYVERNLEMMLHYMDSDDTVFTENSTRQDKGKKEYGYKYFYHYLYMAERELRLEGKVKTLFDGAAHKLISDCLLRQDDVPFCLHKLMLNERLFDYEFAGYGFMESYRRFFKDSGIYRVRKDDFVYSALVGKSNFLFIKKKAFRISLRMGISYCDIRNFVIQDFETSDKGCKGVFQAQGWYYTPFENPPETSDWWQMDHSKRELLCNTSLKVSVEVEERDKGIDLIVDTEGYENIPIRLEIALMSGSSIDSPAFSLVGDAGKKMILKEGYVDIQNDEGQCRIGPGFGNHGFTGHYSGELEDRQNFTLIMTDYSNFKRRLTFEFDD